MSSAWQDASRVKSRTGAAPTLIETAWGVRDTPAVGRGMMRLETLIKLKLFNSSFSSSISSIRVVRAYPPVEIRQTVPCRAIRVNSISVDSTLPPSYADCRPPGDGRAAPKATGCAPRARPSSASHRPGSCPRTAPPPPARDDRPSRRSMAALSDQYSGESGPGPGRLSTRIRRPCRCHLCRSHASVEVSPVPPESPSERSATSRSAAG